MTEISKPEVKELDKMLNFLDKLQASGTINMLAAPEFLMGQFWVDKKESKAVFNYWAQLKQRGER
jgi:hypothetical protein|tara:strand:- start:2999 stop:3193 length:195 start_codon:yes stop_codon:yes gene_type:complete